MKNLSIIMLTGIASVFLFDSCKKKDEPKPQVNVPTEAKQEAISAKSWRMIALTVDPARQYNILGPSVTDWFAQKKGCEQDNLKKYNSDGKVLYDEGATKCNNDDAQTVTGTWVFNPDKTVITETRDSQNKSYIITKLTTDTLKQRYTEESFGTTYTYNAVYIAN